MPFKDAATRRAYMRRYYLDKIKTGKIPSTTHKKEPEGFTGLNHTGVIKTPVQTRDNPTIIPLTTPVSGPPPAPAAQATIIAPVALVLALLIAAFAVVRGAPCFATIGESIL